MVKMKDSRRDRVLKLGFATIIIASVAYMIFYLTWIHPLTKLHKIQSKEWITNLTETLILGAKDNAQLTKIRPKTKEITYWYLYWHIHTEKYTGWVLFHLQNKFSDDMLMNTYLYDFENGTKILEQVPLSFANLQTKKVGDKLVITLGESYYQEIDMVKNTTTLDLKSNKVNIHLSFDIDDYSTNMPPFMPRYNAMRHVTNVDGNETNSPGEWMSDNPMIGKVLNGTINGSPVSSGNYWFDNYIGTNNNYLSSYIWFVILNDDWLIYLLWFGPYDDRNKENTTRPFFIKDRKNDRMIYCGLGGKVPTGFKTTDSLVQPYEMTYKSNSTLGDEKYDDYVVNFKSQEIAVQFRSIPGKSERVFLHDYYKNDKIDANNLEGWDKEYYEVLSNIRYVEYINIITVDIMYEGAKQTFTARQVIDAKYPATSSVPAQIRWR